MASAYEAGINELLESFGANFKFCQAKANYVGGANAQYCIDINGYALSAGESGSGERPSFRTVLSSGDKMSLALALFITQVRQRTDISDLILVFDDPFASQDTGRQFETAARIRELAAFSKQAVVLSHDPRFLHLVKKDATPIEYSEHQIGLDADWRGRICSWSSEEELKADYVRRAERIRGFAGTGQHLPGCSAALLAYDLRLFVEEYLDLRFPGRFAARTLLGAMIDDIDASPDDPLYSERRALREINEFARPDHHRGTSGPDPTQLRAQCKKVMRIVGSY
jgi:wobble nucleotide-excising tRNase